MSHASLWLILFVTLVAGLSAISIDAVMSRREQPGSFATVGPLAAQPNRRPFAARLRGRAVVVGLAFGMAMTLDRTFEDQFVEAHFAQLTWVANVTPPSPVRTTPAVRRHPRSGPR